MKSYRKRLGVYIEEIGNECRYCGSKESLTIDHITAKAIGGKDERENYQVLCRYCNSLKHNMTEDEFKAYLVEYVEKYERRLIKARQIIKRIIK